MHEPAHCTVEELLREDKSLPEAGSGLRSRILRDAGQALLQQQRQRRERWITSIVVASLACLALVCTYLPTPTPHDFTGMMSSESVEQPVDQPVPSSSGRIMQQTLAVGSTLEWESVEATLTQREAASRKLQQALWN
ncbi:MAG TPA: hypothetical protein VHB77_19190 [Planctomycetaceae bacterium]|nr:hypothetical protein [Planctomycetaceae bacterium]